MGGDRTGISKNSLKACLLSAYNSFSSKEEEGNSINRVLSSEIDKEVEEIFKYLSTSEGESLSLKDFVNAITSDGDFSVENVEYFDK
jgi:hypothetical protein